MAEIDAEDEDEAQVGVQRRAGGLRRKEKRIEQALQPFEKREEKRLERKLHPKEKSLIRKEEDQVDHYEKLHGR